MPTIDHPRIKRTHIVDLAPSGLVEGELACEMASTPPRLWIGVPTSIDANNRRLLNADTAIGNYLPLTGGSLSGALTVHNGVYADGFGINGTSNWLYNASGNLVLQSGPFGAPHGWLSLNADGVYYNGAKLGTAGALGDYLPLTGGSINSGGSDPLQILTPVGQHARITYHVQTTRIWSAGTLNDGTFGIADETGAAMRVVFGLDGRLDLAGYITASGNISGSALVSSGANAGFFFEERDVPGTQWNWLAASGTAYLSTSGAGGARLSINTLGTLAAAGSVQAAVGISAVWDITTSNGAVIAAGNIIGDQVRFRESDGTQWAWYSSSPGWAHLWRGVNLYTFNSSGDFGVAGVFTAGSSIVSGWDVSVHAGLLIRNLHGGWHVFVGAADGWCEGPAHLRVGNFHATGSASAAGNVSAGGNLSASVDCHVASGLYVGGILTSNNSGWFYVHDMSVGVNALNIHGRVSVDTAGNLTAGGSLFVGGIQIYNDGSGKLYTGHYRGSNLEADSNLWVGGRHCYNNGGWFYSDNMRGNNFHADNNVWANGTIGCVGDITTNNVIVANSGRMDTISSLNANTHDLQVHGGCTIYARPGQTAAAWAYGGFDARTGDIRCHNPSHNGNMWMWDGNAQGAFYTPTWNSLSDERVKSHIELSRKDALAMINRIDMYEYDIHGVTVAHDVVRGSVVGPDRHQFGFVAQQLQTVMPEVVSEMPPDPLEEPVDPPLLVVDMGQVIAYNTRAIQQLNDTIQQLTDRLATLERERHG